MHFSFLTLAVLVAGAVAAPLSWNTTRVWVNGTTTTPVILPTVGLNGYDNGVWTPSPIATSTYTPPSIAPTESGTRGWATPYIIPSETPAPKREGLDWQLGYTVSTCEIAFFDADGRLLVKELDAGGALKLRARDLRFAPSC